MNEEIKGIEIDNELEEKIDESLQNDQRKFILKEKMKALKQELGEDSWKKEEVIEYRKVLDKLKIDKKIKDHFSHEIDKYEIMSDDALEVSVMHNYLDWVLHLPWNKTRKENANFDEVYKELNKSHFGMDEIKTRISEYVAIKNLNRNIQSPIICLVGPPGVGKTTFAESISIALNRKFVKISLGGMSDSAELVGHRRAYIGSNPGKIISSLIKCESKNPVFLLDEVDKLKKDYKGDPASTLLDILDTSQNKRFVDNYLDEEVDLSKVLFVLTANDISSIPVALLDRLEIIDLTGYSDEEKLLISETNFKK